EPGVPEAAGGQAFGGRGADGAAEGAGGAEADVVEQDHQHVGGAGGGRRGGSRRGGRREGRRRRAGPPARWGRRTAAATARSVGSWSPDPWRRRSPAPRTGGPGWEGRRACWCRAPVPPLAATLRPPPSRVAGWAGITRWG